MDIELQECRVLRIEPGDILVFEVESPIDSETAGRIKARLDGVLAGAGHAGVPSMVVAGGRLVTTRVVPA